MLFLHSSTTCTGKRVTDIECPGQFPARGWHRLQQRIVQKSIVFACNKARKLLQTSSPVWDIYILNLVLCFSMRPFHCHSWPLLNWIPRSILRSLSVILGLFIHVSSLVLRIVQRYSETYPISCIPTLTSSTPGSGLPSDPTIGFSVSRLSLNT